MKCIRFDILPRALVVGVCQYTPTQASSERDLFWVSERPISNPGETPFTVFTTYVTGKGQIYFVNKFLKQKELV